MLTKRLGDRIYQFFKSRKLAVSLLFLLAVIAIFGTIFNRGEIDSGVAPLDPSIWLSYFETGEFYHSPIFISAIGLLFVNLTVCTYDRLKSNWRKLTGVSYAVEDNYILSLPFHFSCLAPQNPLFLKEFLSSDGYKIYNNEGIFYGEKGKIHSWGTYITHFSIILVIIAGTISALFSYVGTVGIFEQKETDTYYNWTKKKYQVLPFTIRVEDLNVDYYTPVIEAEIGDKRISLKKGDEIFYKNDKIVFFDFLPDSMVMNNEVYSISEFMHDPAVLFKIYRDGNFISNYWIFAKDTGYRNSMPLPYSIKVLNNLYLVKSSESLLNIIENGEIKLRESVSPNKSINYKGLNIYFWGFNQDAYRNYFTGLQLSYEPCLWFTWAALGGVLCGLCLTFFISSERVWIKYSSGQILIGGKTSGDKEKFNERMQNLVNKIKRNL
ncbi:MAG: cytochrome c biogenesis protein ResB [bacterium]